MASDGTINGGAGGGRAGGALDIEQLKSKYKELDTARTRARANLETAQKQLDELKAEARAAYGTDDLDALRQRLTQMRDENERKRADYQAHLEQVQAKLKEVEQTFAAAGSEKKA
ncbi:MAG TPA: hypothetical protein VF796_15925 [Humisphaera sp.]